MSKRVATAAPAVAMTVVSMVLTLAVVVMWLGGSMPWQIALVVGLGLDGGWLATLAYERRLAAQGDHSTAVTTVGWAFGLAATGVLVAHALTEDATGAWLAVSWLPLGAKALWLVHGMWERTALTPVALDAIRGIQQEARDEAAVARAQLRAQAGTEETRLTAVTEAGARVARVQAKTAERLSGAWSTLEAARQGEGTARALTCVTDRVAPGAQPRWELPVWGPYEPVPALDAAPALSEGELDRIVTELHTGETPPLSYRELSLRFRAAGHSASETRLRAAWRRITATAS
ncbi:protein spdB [Streptomyces sp. CB02009]|uniref:protein spdB n=1 Tax=Streptomyces sp. CB02009 TaxID=1703938 RepID=UPI00093942F6|nr:protein spdB [Streptomyces sp. CB02009]OKJ60028.1 protein spdB [Streptomyces sp. CB02009]